VGYSLETTRLSLPVLDSFGDLGEYRTEWNGLVDHSSYPNVFRRWEWISTWWKWFGKGRELYLIKLTRGPELVGLVPLYSARTRFGGRKLAWIGDGGPTYPEYLGPIIHREHAEAVVKAVADHLHDAGRHWTEMSFPDVPPDDTATIAIAAALAERCPSIQRPGEICPYFHLPQSYETLLKRLSSHGRQRKKRQLRRANEELDAHLTVLCDTDAIASIFPTMVRLSVSSKGIASPFLNPEYLSFHREACEHLSRDSLARVYMLHFRDEPAAFLYGFTYDNKFYAFQTGYDSGLDAFSPGDIIFQMAYEHLIGEQVEEFDYLRGGEEYKNQFGDMRRRTETTLIFRYTGLGYGSQWIRSNVVAPARHRVKQWLAR
jgi:CelD/BcsL family acetyltransferase involved in cellulose biosynthesis